MKSVVRDSYLLLIATKSFGSIWSAFSKYLIASSYLFFATARYPLETKHSLKPKFSQDIHKNGRKKERNQPTGSFERERRHQ